MKFGFKLLIFYDSSVVFVLVWFFIPHLCSVTPLGFSYHVGRVLSIGL